MMQLILALDVLSAAITLGVNANEAIQKISALAQEKHAAGETLTREDLARIFDAGDDLEREVAEAIRAMGG